MSRQLPLVTTDHVKAVVIGLWRMGNSDLVIAEILTLNVYDVAAIIKDYRIKIKDFK